MEKSNYLQINSKIKIYHPKLRFFLIYENVTPTAVHFVTKRAESSFLELSESEKELDKAFDCISIQ
jgi:hypothetical protein